MSAEACAEAPSVHADGLSGLRRKRVTARALDALRAHQDHVRVTVRWHLKQRRPRPALPTGIELATAAAHGALFAAATILTIGG